MKGLLILLFCIPIMVIGQNTITISPSSDGSFTGTWTGSAGTRYVSVNDYPDASGTSLLQLSSTAGGACYFNSSLPTVPSNATNITVYVDYYDVKNASQSCNIAARLRISMLPYDAVSHNPANGVWTSRTDTWTTDPTTGSTWTVAGVNAIEGIGFVSTDGSPAISVSSIRLRITYSLPPARKVRLIN